MNNVTVDICPYEWASETPEGEFLTNIILEQYPIYTKYRNQSVLLAEFNDHENWETVEALLQKASLRWEDRASSLSLSENEFKIHATHLLVEASVTISEVSESDEKLVPLDATLYIVDELWKLLEKEGI